MYFILPSEEDSVRVSEKNLIQTQPVWWIRELEESGTSL